LQDKDFSLPFLDTLNTYLKTRLDNLKVQSPNKGVLVDNMKIKSTHLATLLDYLGRQSTQLKTKFTYREVSVDNLKINFIYLEVLLTYLKRHFTYLETLLTHLGVIHRQLKINYLHPKSQVWGLTNIHQHHSHFAKHTRQSCKANFANRLFSAKHKQQ